MPNTRIVILAAGKGTRMKSDLPKPLIKVAGEPMVTRLIRSVKASGIDQRPVVVIGAWSESAFRAELGDTVDYAIQTEQLGTGHALRCAKEAVGEADVVIVLYGDHPFIGAEVIRKLSELQSQNPSSVAMLTATVPSFDGDYQTFIKWGRVLRDTDGKVVAIREYKDASPSELTVTEVNPSILAFPAVWAFQHLDALKNENASGEYYLTDLIGTAMTERIHIVTFSANPLDVIGINSPEELARAESMIK